MKTLGLTLMIMVNVLWVWLLTCAFYMLSEHESKEKNHIKLVKKGCCQFRINEYTNEVVHFEGCQNH
jgi:hypothetical protein